MEDEANVDIAIILSTESTSHSSLNFNEMRRFKVN